MRKLMRATLIYCLIATAVTCVTAQSAGRGAKTASKPAVGPAVGPAGPTAGKVKTSAAPSASASVATDELAALLPASDVIAILDVGRAFNELLPKLAGFTTGGVDKMAKSIQEFTIKTGVDPSKIQNAVFSFSMDGPQGTGVILLQGISPDAKQIEAALKEFGGEFSTSDYKGKSVYLVVSKLKAPSAGPLSIKTDEVAVAALGGQRVAFGDLKMVKQVIDIQTGAAKGGVSPAMIGALNETRASALLRFALNIPENLRSEAANQGDLFKSVAAIKMILGTFDVASDLSISLDTIIRTPTQNDATELENGLKGLVDLVRGIFGGGDQKSNVFSQLLDQVKIGSKASEVSFSISLPRALLDQLSKKETPPPAEKKL